jgi:hypothetical protein
MRSCFFPFTLVFFHLKCVLLKEGSSFGGQIMLQRRFVQFLMCLALLIGFSTNVAHAGEILFISSMDPVMLPGDDALKAFMEGLGHTVTYFDDDEDEAATEVAAAAADLVYISESVSSQRIRLEITEIETPMIITEMYAWDEMGLMIGVGTSPDCASTNIEIVNPDHYLAAGFSGTMSVLNALSGERGAARFANGDAGDEATVIARATLADGITYDVFYIYEKGANLPVAPADSSPQVAADMRICLGFDEQSYLLWNDNAYSLLQVSIEYALGMNPNASNPRPKVEQIEVPRDAVLQWSAGGFADKHNVYFGKVFEDVNQASVDDPRDVLVAQDIEENTYDPDGLLDYGYTYYWRVDELSDTHADSPWRGDIWSFTALNYLVVVDDFEDYKDYSPDEIWNTWIDGYGDATNGSTVGDPDPDFNAGGHYVETDIVHSGEQSMPLFYNNTAGLSEATRAINDNWTQGGVVTLTLFYHGDAANAVVPMYVALNGNAVVTNDEANAVLVTEWTKLDIPLQAFADKGVNLANVASMSIGFGNKANPVAGGSGVMYFDDIRLYLPEP